MLLFFFFNDTATTEIYTLSLHDALPISEGRPVLCPIALDDAWREKVDAKGGPGDPSRALWRTLQEKLVVRSEEYTSELQSRQYLVCRLLLEKKKKQKTSTIYRKKTDKDI